MGIILEAQVSLIFRFYAFFSKNYFQILAIFKPCGKRDLHRESTNCKWVCEMNRGIHCKSGTSFMGFAMVNAGISSLMRKGRTFLIPEANSRIDYWLVRWIHTCRVLISASYQLSKLIHVHLHVHVGIHMNITTHRKNNELWEVLGQSK